jgi:ElaB/YqjD/DUF883 family membrane-anchored ribosome-binding protein
MNNEAFTAPSPELKGHAQDLKEHATQGAKDIRKDVTNIAGDVKKQATRGFEAVREEANSRVSDAKGQASDFLESARDYATQHPATTFGIGVLVGLFLARRHR